MSVRTSGTTTTADGRRSEGIVGGQPPAPAGEPAALGTGLGLDPDDLPDGLVVADETGRVICFNAAAARITDIAPEDAVGRPLEHALPLQDIEGRRWWRLTDPYGGLAIRRGQPERNLLLPAAARPTRRNADGRPPLPRARRPWAPVSGWIPTTCPTAWSSPTRPAG